MDLSSTDSHYSERNCKYCKSELHSSVNCRKKLNRELRPTTPNYSKGNYSQGSTQKEYTKTGTQQVRDLNKDKKITTITDASVGTEYDAQSRIGVIIWYGKNIFNVYSNKSTNKCVSSTEAELHAIYEGYADSETLKATLTELGEGKDKEITMITDSKPAIEGLNRSYLQPKQKFTWIKTEIIKEKLKEKTIKLIKINGKDNIADLLTKPVSISDFDRFIKVLNNQITPQDILASTDY
ncbi:hypothetical protein SEUBUCD646_0M02550 [Saccharomyces eubayanus]|nr:hypothetical protein SEUBUCD646_0M02550 [Saccharomyces eubayanus]